MSAPPQVASLLAPGSDLYTGFFGGSVSRYAQNLVLALESNNPKTRELRVASLEISAWDIYDEMSRLQAALTEDNEQLTWGRYMSPARLAGWLVEQTTLGEAVGDTAAGIGTIVAMCRLMKPTARVFGLELSQNLVELGRLAQYLAWGSSDYEWCQQGDLLELGTSPRLDTLIMSPPWVLLENIPAHTLQRLAANSAYSSITRYPLFDLCVPFVVESVARALRIGGTFVAALPLRVQSAPEWNCFRSGELFQMRGIEASVDFRPAPCEHLDAYPTRFVTVVGERRA